MWANGHHIRGRIAQPEKKINLMPLNCSNSEATGLQRTKRAERLSKWSKMSGVGHD